MLSRLGWRAGASILLLTSYVLAVIGCAIWIADALGAVAASFLLAGVLLTAGLIALVLARPQATKAGGPSPAADQDDARAPLEGLEALCARRPLVGLGLAVALGFLDGMDERRPPR
ncbi:MAG: hypothetical protein HXY25_05070 [Alphaproteobacteria bacterium]|nr:hypothetical protein [Alphaproteobacteria bacterium]